jgi:pilus assembly protein CpaF
VIDAALVARVRSEVSSGLDPATLLALYADPARRRLIRERVRSAAGARLSDAELERLCADLFGFGCLQTLLDDPQITDVLVNAPDRIFVERDGRLERVAIAFRDGAELSDLLYRIASSVGRELTIERPFVDARMRDGSRANAVIEPIGGPCLSIRKFRPLSMPLAGPSSWVASGSAATPRRCSWTRSVAEGTSSSAARPARARAPSCARSPARSPRTSA